MIQSSDYRAEQEDRSGRSLERVWAQGGFALVAQMPPFAHPRLGDVITRVAVQIGCFDAALVAEAPGGAVSLSSIALAVLFQRAGISTMAQLSGRDKNRLALQADILGLGALHIPYLLIEMRPQERANLGENPTARLVADLDGPQLLAVAARMRDEARLLSGASIRTPPVFGLGAQISLAAPPTAEALASAQFLVAAPLPDMRELPRLLTAFQQTHAACWPSRPLLVSLPFSTSFRSGSDAWHECLELMRLLQEFPCVRGCNLVVEQLSDLEFLGAGVASGQLSLERSE